MSGLALAAPAQQWGLPMSAAEQASERLPAASRPSWAGRREGAVVRAAQNGSEDALEELFRRHWRSTHRAAFLIVHDSAAAEDIAQESFLAAIRALDSFDRRRPFGPWLHRITVNRAIDFTRSRRIRGEVGIPDGLEGEPAPTERPELSDDLLAALRGLGPEQRAVVVLRHLLGYTPGEIGEMLGMPRGTVELAAAARARSPPAARRGGRGRMSEPALEKRLRELRVPGEDDAEDRAWPVIRAAYAERAPAPTRRPVRTLIAAAVAAVVAAVLVLTPAGAEVVDVVRDAVGIDDAPTLPELGPLPAAGELLVDSEEGPWIVDDEGSKHRLGDYEQSTFSAPRGLFIGATDGRRLVALEPDGDVRWTVTAPAAVSDPRWAPSGVRVAYRSGDDLRVVNGNGTNDHLVASDVAPIAPAWRPTAAMKLMKGAGAEQVSYVNEDGRVPLVDADTGDPVPGAEVSDEPSDGRQDWAIREIGWSADGTHLLERSNRELVAGPHSYDAARGTRLADAALSPRGDELAVIERGEGTSTIKRIDLGRGDASNRTLFSGPGAVEDLTWSPDSRWLLAGWRDADQWLFIEAARPRHLVAVDDVAEQFAPGGFPQVSGWVLPQR